jgi:hypothetical protein
MTNAKIFSLLGCGVLLLVGGFFAFVVLIAVLWQVADDAEDAKKSKVIIVVQHRLYDDRSLLLGHQCFSHIVLIRDHPWEVSADGKEARYGDNVYKVVSSNFQQPNFRQWDNMTQFGWPQPFGKVPPVSDLIEHEFKIDEPKTYYYLVEVSGQECVPRPDSPDEALGFKTGQFTIGANETKRIEVNFTKP